MWRARGLPEGSAGRQDRLDRRLSDLVVAARACKFRERDAGAGEYRPRSVPRQPLGKFSNSLDTPASHDDHVCWPSRRVGRIDTHIETVRRHRALR